MSGEAHPTHVSARVVGALLEMWNPAEDSAVEARDGDSIQASSHRPYANPAAAAVLAAEALAAEKAVVDVAPTVVEGAVLIAVA